jgi:coenzyme F420-0:L-glutamate ligase/coenzyme F420-1:gamma-L-glutamate ligase
MSAISLIAIPDIPIIQEGDDLVAIILDRAQAAQLVFQPGDVLVVTQKVVSKAEGRRVELSGVRPSERARGLAVETGKDARLLEVVLGETRQILRQREQVIISETRDGWVCANAGVDRSNVGPPGHGAVLLLPKDPDRSACCLRRRIAEQTGVDVAVIIADTQGRPFRLGAVGVAVGVAGMAPLLDLRGREDLYGRKLASTVVGVADEFASAADLVMGQSDEGRPVVLIRGASFAQANGRARDIQRPKELDLFR